MHTGKLADLSLLTLFGKDLSEKPLSPWRFYGKRHEDAALELIDFGFRFYHPKSAQWLTQDPIGESDGPNLYAYVKNNPASLVDRFGLFGDGWSFGSAWDSFTETCSSAWDSISDTCSRSWDAVTDFCSSFGNSSDNGDRDTCDNIWIDSVIENLTVDFGNSQGSVISPALDFSPLGNIKSICELITGKDLITGEETSRMLSAIGMIPLCGNVVKGEKTLAKLYKASKIKWTTKVKVYLPFTRRNFRKNLEIATGIYPPKNVHAHHVFPKEFTKKFAEKGINVHDPKFGVWWESTPHWTAHGKGKYNEVWDKVLNQKPSFDGNQLLEKGKEIMGAYGKTVYY